MVDRVVEYGFHLDALAIDFHPIVNQTHSIAVVCVPVYMPAVDGPHGTSWDYPSIFPLGLRMQASWVAR